MSSEALVARRRRVATLAVFLGVFLGPVIVDRSPANGWSTAAQYLTSAVLAASIAVVVRLIVVKALPRLGPSS